MIITNRLRWSVSACVLVAPLASLVAQPLTGELSVAAAARDTCIRALAEGDESRAELAERTAQRIYRELIRGQPRDVAPKVGLARLYGQCRMQRVGTMSKNGVFRDAQKLLTEAVVLDSTHWEARFTLAQLYYRAPEFLGHRKSAIRELETLLRQQGERTDFPEMATPYLMLGELYRREKRIADAAQLLRRGQRLFPSDARFEQRLQKLPQT